MLCARALTLATKMSRPPSAAAALPTQARSASVSATSILLPQLFTPWPLSAATVVHRRLMAGAKRHVAAFFRQQLGDGAADAARAAGDDRILALEIEVHTPLLSADVPVL